MDYLHIDLADLKTDDALLIVEIASMLKQNDDFEFRQQLENTCHNARFVRPIKYKMPGRAYLTRIKESIEKYGFRK